MELNCLGFYPSENYLCVATLLELVLKNFGYNFNRYEIANYFGVNIPLDVKIDNVQQYYHIEDKNKFGIMIYSDSVNNLFHHFGIKLTEKYVSINTIPEESFVSTVKELLEKAFVICGYDYGYVYDDPKNICLGHVSIITEITDDTVMLFDPGPRNFGIKKLEPYRLFYGIKRKKDGLWCICE